MMSDRKQRLSKTRLLGWTVICLAVGILLGGLTDTLSTPQVQARPEQSTLPASFSDLAKTASPSVVNISTVKVVQGGGHPSLPFGPNDPFRDFFERFFRDQMPKDFKQRSLGTGFIIDRDGYIITNNHVVANADVITVKLSDKREFDAKVIGKDPKTDIALIRIENAEDIIPLPMGDSDALDVGDWVVAIGNPFGLGHTVTAGIVSAKYRQIGAGAYDNFIQTDASINPGNSGGPLLNTMGEVIGINAMIFSQSGGSVGIGFAIPINMAKDLLPQLKKGRVIRGWLGVLIQQITPEIREKLGLKEDRGALVSDVTPGGPADKAGIQRGDVIVAADGKEIMEMKELPYLIAAFPVGKKVAVEVIRKGKTKTIEVTLGELKEEGGEVVEEIPETGSRLGMVVEEMTPELASRFGLSGSRGVIVLEVKNGTPAADAGVKPGDMILEIDQEPVTNLAGYRKKLDAFKEGDTILLLLKRQGGTLYLTLKLE